MIQVVSPALLIPWATITMSHHRMQRVSELVKREVSEIVLELNLTDCGFVTITAAEISPDLKDGRIYMSVIGTAAHKQRALETLDRKHGHIQHELGRRIVLKYTPRLKFVLDDTEDKASHIEHLLDELGESEPSNE
jgi:ribosome-binding factor A